MHSSRIRTGRSLTVCQSLLLGGGPPSGEGRHLLGGPSFQGVSFLGGLIPGGPTSGGSPSGGVSLGGLFLGGSPSGGSPSRGAPSRRCLLLGDASFWETPPVDRITDTSKNITLASTSLRPVTITQ